MRSLLLLLLFFAPSLLAYKVAIFTPTICNSQLIFNKRVAETLADAGFNVTLVAVRVFEHDQPAIKINENVHVVNIDAKAPGFSKAMQAAAAKTAYHEHSFLESEQRQGFTTLLGSMVKSCEVLVKNKDFIEWLRAEKFDVAFSHMFTYCYIGLFHEVGIESWVWMSTGALIDHMVGAIGLPAPPSYVPPLIMESLDRMSFLERVKSFVMGFGMDQFYKATVTNQETALFRRHVRADFPDLYQLAAHASLVMLNSDEMLEPARPTLEKIVYVGGLGMTKKAAKPLTGEFAEIASKAKSLVVFSFGSAQNATQMPESWKTAFLDAFTAFPDVHFILRYDGTDLKGRLPANVHISKWLPQADLLQHSKTRGFISHGGYNGVQESINAGQPMLAIPLMGDQPKNARIAERHGLARVLSKSEVASSENIIAGLRAILYEEKYRQAAQRLGQILQKKPMSSEDRLVKYTEFLAEFRHLDNLTPYSVHLNFVQKHSLDVIAFLLLLLLSVLAIILKVVLVVYGKVTGFLRGKVKNE